jgi:hypothetical protein
VESTQLEAYIARMYDDTKAYVDAHPFSDSEPQGAPGDSPDVTVD